VQARGDSDLTPIDASGEPREVAPLIEAINLHAERQREMTEAQRRFIADASHQLKTPLTVLKTQAALALAQADAQAMRGIVRQMHNSTDVTARVIQQLLALAKSEPGLELPAERADLVEIARAATFELLPQALKKSVELGFDADGAAPVEGQPLLLRELVANLVDNAVRYARGGGNVAVSVRRTDDASVQLVVEDDGPGIAPAEREKVFERFYRAGGASSEGSGLGLAIVRQIAERHRATIRIDAGAGGAGTRVTVRMPGSTALHDESEARRGSRSNPWRARIEQPADRPPTS
jgi:two-component system sensor histidine kinase TctE